MLLIAGILAVEDIVFGVPDFAVAEVGAVNVAETEAIGGNALNGKDSGVGATELGGTGTGLGFSDLEGEIGVDGGDGLADFLHVIKHGSGDADAYRGFGTAVAVEENGNLVEFVFVGFAVGLCAEQTEFLSGEGDEADGALGTDSGGSEQTGSLEHGADTGAAVYGSCANVVSVEVAGDDDIFIGVFGAFDFGYDTVIFNRAEAEMIADVELEHDVATLTGGTLYEGKLVLVELNLGLGGEVVEVGVGVVDEGTVVEGADGGSGSLDKAKNTGIAHLTVEEGRILAESYERSVGVVDVVVARDAAVDCRHRVVVVAGGSTDRVAFGRLVDGEAGALAPEEHPCTLELAFHALKLSLGGGLGEHVADLTAMGAGGVGGCGEVEVIDSVDTVSAAKPCVAVEADRHFTGLFLACGNAPLGVLMQHPVGSVIIGGRADETTTESSGEHVEVVADLRVGGALGYDLFNISVFGRQAGSAHKYA